MVGKAGTLRARGQVEDPHLAELSLNASANFSTATPPSALPYEDLVESIAVRRDRDAFAQLFNGFAPKVKGFMIRKGLAPDRAEDIAIETFVKIWNRADTFNPTHGSAAAWIFRIARNAYIDIIRHERHPDEFAAMDIASAQT